MLCCPRDEILLNKRQISSHIVFGHDRRVIVERSALYVPLDGGAQVRQVTGRLNSQSMAEPEPERDQSLSL